MSNTRKKRVLFVCIENSNRSQMAEAFARIHGGDNIEAYSAGSRPSGTVNARAVEFMGELGYDLTQHRSKTLADLFAGRVGRIQSGGTERLSEACGEKFTDYVEAKRKAGHL